MKGTIGLVLYLLLAQNNYITNDRANNITIKNQDEAVAEIKTFTCFDFENVPPKYYLGKRLIKYHKSNGKYIAYYE